MEVIKSFYCVKYVLSNNGKIPLLELKTRENGKYAYGGYAYGGYAYGGYAYTGEHIQYQIGRDCFESEADAVVAATRMRDRKIESLRKQIDRLENLQFSTR